MVTEEGRPRAALRGILDLLFPSACQVCTRLGVLPLCDSCRTSFQLIRPPVCQKCGRPLRGPQDLICTCVTCRHRRWYFRAARAVGIYDGQLRSTAPQNGLAADARRSNVRGAFQVDRPVLRGVILLADEVISTGFTVSECAKALLRAGASEVCVIAANGQAAVKI